MLQTIRYAIQIHTDEETAAHFVGLLGESEASTDFIAAFNRKKYRSQKAGAAKIASASPSPSSSSAAATPQRSESPFASHTITLSSLEEIDLALKALELKDSKGEKHHRRKCNCQATRHPLQEVAPNCLSCGKIICDVEGLGPCSFCGKPLLSSSQILELSSELKRDRQALSSLLSNKKTTLSSRHETNRLWAVKAGGDLQVLGKQNSGNEAALLEARRRKDTLLEYERNSAQRTKLIDHASDFDTGGTQYDKWASPRERAEALKRQQRARREAEAAAVQERHSARVMTINVGQKGKAQVTIDRIRAPKPQVVNNDDTSEEEADSTIKRTPSQDIKTFARPRYVPSQIQIQSNGANGIDLSRFKEYSPNQSIIANDDDEREELARRMILQSGTAEPTFSEEQA